MKPAQSSNLWAPIARPHRGSEWIIWTCVRCTRKEAKRAYLAGVTPGLEKQHLARVRFARVSITEMEVAA